MNISKRMTDNYWWSKINVIWKIIYLLDHTPNEPSKFIRRSCVQINDDSHGEKGNDNLIRLYTSIRSCLCNYSGAYIHMKGIITIPITAATNNCKKSNI